MVICSVGGGGLLLGILRGLERNNWSDVPVLAMETYGAESLNEAVKQNKLVTLDGIKSIAKSLGSTKVAEALLPAIEKYDAKVYSKLCTDMESIEAVERFLAEHRFFVEPVKGETFIKIRSELLSISTVIHRNKTPPSRRFCQKRGLIATFSFFSRVISSRSNMNVK